MKRCTATLLILLTSCYYDVKTGCTQHLFSLECPHLSLHKMYRANTDLRQKNIDYKDCLNIPSRTIEKLSECMKNKGYSNIHEYK